MVHAHKRETGKRLQGTSRKEKRPASARSHKPRKYQHPPGSKETNIPFLHRSSRNVIPAALGCKIRSEASFLCFGTGSWQSRTITACFLLWRWHRSEAELSPPFASTGPAIDGDEVGNPIHRISCLLSCMASLLPSVPLPTFQINLIILNSVDSPTSAQPRDKTSPQARGRGG